MFRFIRKSRFTKVFAMVLLASFLAELLQPLQLYALTGGPSQPEMAGFTPVSTDNMVDLFSGDFHYTIPIMTVPGPNGGFPINLNYNSNIGMEHEASWVGLGWNLNPGAINRQVRGIPDDFCGDEIEKTYKRRDNNTFLFSTGGGGEVFGANFGIGVSQSKSFIYNTYNGITLCRRFGVSASYVRNDDSQDERSKIATANYGINMDSDNGVTTSFSMNGGSKNLKLGFNYGYNSKSGTYTYGNQISLVHMNDQTFKEGGGIGIGHSFSTAANLPPIHIPLSSTTWGVSFQAGGSGMYLEGFGSINCNIVNQKTPAESIKTASCGILYAEQATEDYLQDFNREKDICVNRDAKNLPLPVMTNDVYNITGELLGGAFRAYRSDYGHFYDNKIKNITSTTDAGVDLGFGGGAQIGVNLAVNYGESENGDWSDEDYDTFLSFKGKGNYNGQTVPRTLYEPFYFKMVGEQTSSEANTLADIGGNNAVRFEVTQNYTNTFWDGRTYNYSIDNTLSNGSINQYEQRQRAKRTSNIEYKTGNSGEGRQTHHIREFSIVNADGERFTYGKTLYNHEEKEVQFSIKCHYCDISKTTCTCNTEGNANGSERVGKEKLYSCTKTPPYPYSYLITSITSPDYVDINRNGEPDDADLGYWVRFSYADEYCSSNPYKWRFPYNGANYFMGDRSNQNDDMGSYNYGTKEIAYLDTIETKTHKAVFHISQRKDALGAFNEYTGGKDISQKLYKLDSIQLFSKEDMTIPIKTAVFEYDYYLCKGVPNNADNNNNTSNYGKLTLRKVYFKYALSEKGQQNPYCFRYNGFNPNYAPEKMDRWGNYKGDANYFEHYTTQDPDSANQWSTAWLLKEIDLPEGGTIKIDYESDDYAYVQDKQAMYMAKVNNRTSFNKEGDGKYYIYFNKKTGVDARDYVKEFKHNLMYFKMAVSYDGYKDPDYIQGYVEINPENIVDYGNYGKVEVRPFRAYPMHPVWFMALQYLKNNRPDLMFNGADEMENNSDAAAFFRALVSGGIIDKVYAMYGNDAFYRHCINSNDFGTLCLNHTGMPSYIRLNVPDKIKYGGGSRVKALTIVDNWSKSDTSYYKQEYFYGKTENGKMISSGVAEYEPTVGAEENALRYPVYDEVKGLFFVEDEMYCEEPYGESYFPAANVGYSQVIVRTYTPENVSFSTGGIQRHEFYTARDFPIVVSQTDLCSKVDPVPNVLQLITAGFKQESSSCYSQGYLIELNDMHGKPKSVSTIPYIPLRDENELIPTVEQSAYTSKVEYEYFTKTENGINKIDNKVDVLLGDNHVEKKTLGQSLDFFIDQRMNHSYSYGGGLSSQLMFATYFPVLTGFSAMPSFDCFEETVKSVAVTKVIYNTGILKKTKVYNKGSIVTTENLQFDPYTGKPLLTSVTNEFEQPVYNYSMPAYWYYHNMGSAAENYRARYYENPLLPSGDTTFWQYDVIPYNNSTATINGINDHGMATCWLPNSTTSFSAYGKEIYRSRFSNQLNAEAAALVSLVCPTDPNNRRLTVVSDFNGQRDTCVVLHNCNGDSLEFARIYYDPILKELYFFRGDPEGKICYDNLCDLVNDYSRHLKFAVDLGNEHVDLIEYLFSQSGEEIMIYHRNNPQQPVASFTWDDPNGYFPECVDGVLQASATEYQSIWDYDYTDAGISTTVNENYLGIPNIYRSLRANLYVTDRNQTGQHDQYNTNIAYDGTFSSFAFFSQGLGNKDNMQKPWTWTAEITKYSPFNFEIENRNALGIYSSALYGYKQSLVTAVANNARYEEIGYDSFENDSQTAIGNARGHLVLDSQHSSISTDYAHSGKHSLQTSNLSLSFGGNTPLKLQEGKDYVFSCWVRKASCTTLGNLGEDYIFTYNANNVNVSREAKVDCWQRVEVEFTATSAQTGISLSSADNATFYVDDIRIAPANSTIKSYVYDPQNYRLVAELDDNNYTTFYNYDEEGILVQVKKETERGIMTIKTTRQNLKKHNSTNL